MEDIKKELNKLKRKFKTLEKSRKEIAFDLCEEAAFMKVTLAKLQAKINTEGPVIRYTNGNGKMTTTAHPAQVAYTSMIKNYNQTMKILADMLPPEGAEEDDDLTLYLKGKLK